MRETDVERSERIQKLIKEPTFDKSKPIYNALDRVYDEYRKATELDYIKKPIAYALYKTWEYYDKLSTERNG